MPSHLYMFETQKLPILSLSFLVFNYLSFQLRDTFGIESLIGLTRRKLSLLYLKPRNKSYTEYQRPLGYPNGLFLLRRRQSYFYLLKYNLV
jgi:hypothetical protein